MIRKRSPENKPSLKLKYIDFWEGFDLPNFMFYKLLLEKYDVIVSDQPDLLFYSVYGKEHSKYTCTKIFFTAENVRPDFRECDYAFSFDFHSNIRNYRLPLYAFYGNVTDLINRKLDEQEILKRKKKFCCFIVSNSECEIRNNFFTQFSKQRHIDSGGKLYNNIGGTVKSKREFIKDYKFVIAFENSSFPGYVTEKIFEPFLEDCIPIYWGNPLIDKDFNPRRFINVQDYDSFEEAINHILEVDKNEEKFLQYLREPVFSNDMVNEYVKESNIVKRLDEIVMFNNTRTGMLKTYQKLRPFYCSIKFQFMRIEKLLSITTINKNDRN